jgi:hypothetical protein
MLRRLAGGNAEGGAGESTKKEPSPGEPSIDPASDVQGDADAFDMTRANAGESMSMASLATTLAFGDRTGSVWRSARASRDRPEELTSLLNIDGAIMRGLFSLFSLGAAQSEGKGGLDLMPFPSGSIGGAIIPRDLLTKFACDLGAFEAHSVPNARLVAGKAGAVC